METNPMAVGQSTVAIALVGHRVDQQHRETIGEQFGVDRLSAHGDQAGGEKREAEREEEGGRSKEVPSSMALYSSRSRLAVWAQALAKGIGPQYDADGVEAIKRRGSRQVDGVATVAGVGGGGIECKLAVAGRTTRVAGDAVGVEMAGDGEFLADEWTGCLAAIWWRKGVWGPHPWVDSHGAGDGGRGDGRRGGGAKGVSKRRPRGRRVPHRIRGAIVSDPAEGAHILVADGNPVPPSIGKPDAAARESSHPRWQTPFGQPTATGQLV